MFAYKTYFHMYRGLVSYAVLFEPCENLLSCPCRICFLQYPFPIYLIFNPYHSDEIHYVGDEALINENLFHEWGPVFTGTLPCDRPPQLVLAIRSLPAVNHTQMRTLPPIYRYPS